MLHDLVDVNTLKNVHEPSHIEPVQHILNIQISSRISLRLSLTMACFDSIPTKMSPNPGSL